MGLVPAHGVWDASLPPLAEGVPPIGGRGAGSRPRCLGRVVAQLVVCVPPYLPASGRQGLFPHSASPPGEQQEWVISRFVGRLSSVAPSFWGVV